MTEKEIFVENMRKRTKKFAVDVILFCNSLNRTRSSSVVEYQLVKCATSVGSNYRAACRSRSKPEFFSKICIVVEEADESEYWFNIIEEANLSKDQKELSRLKNEANEIIRIMTKAKDSTYKG